jgi:hypothetical protein
VLIHLARAQEKLKEVRNVGKKRKIKRKGCRKAADKLIKKIKRFRSI